ncbi:DUF7426 family protein [Enemella dayhoffiae]|uniref:DUF7426 family protein n=1 Tax=Enemella dayhoffiae TaxID=2016507 RepID=UPI0015954690|nr:hypothetical protein [Enemella dayhoffiae]
MAFRPPTQVFQDHIDLPVPIRGDVKTYRIESVSIRTGQFVQELSSLMIAAQQGQEISDADRERLKLDDDQEQEFKKALLGEAYDQMVDDGVSWEAMKIVTQTVMYWTVHNREAAEEFWEAAMVEAPKAPNRETRRRSEKSTQKQGSPAGTTKTSKK